MSSGQYRVNTIRGVMDYFYRDGNLPNEASSRCIRPISRTGQLVASQGEIDIQYGIWIVHEKWAGNEPRILGRCRQTHDTPGERWGWSARGTRWVCDCDNRLERPAVAIGAMNPRSWWTPLL